MPRERGGGEAFRNGLNLHLAWSLITQFNAGGASYRGFVNNNAACHTSHHHLSSISSVLRGVLLFLCTADGWQPHQILDALATSHTIQKLAVLLSF